MNLGSVTSKRHMAHLGLHSAKNSGTKSASASGKGLELHGNKISTERYDITFAKDDVLVTDRKTGETVRVWGDPHLWTKDGDKAGFHDKPITLDLADGTKITFKPTQRGADGKSFLDQVGVMNGNLGYLVGGLHGEKPLAFDQLTSGDVDAAMLDGTVLRAGEHLDDLVLAATGKELQGADASAMDGEHQLDGIGGESSLDFTALENATPEQKGDMYSRLFAALQKLQGKMENLVDDIENLANQKVKKGSSQKLDATDKELLRIKEALANLDPNDAKFGEKKKALEDAQEAANVQRAKLQKELGDWVDTNPEANVEGELQKKQFELQQIQQLVQQYTTMMTNLSASDHQAKMAVISSLRK